VAAARYALYLESSRVERKKEIVAREKDHLLNQQQKEFEREAEQKEHQILELEQEKLRNELDHKSQEMANLLLNFSRKNEALTMIKEELMKIYAKLKISSTSTEAKQMLVTLNSQIDTNMQSDDLLKRIEDQFDLVHNGFTKKLRTAYPELTQKELLMCVYLRMDLSTKEIAPLLNISVRGVETMRYRIRKKFDIDREANLFDFLSKFSD
jgi:DNA-binding CsgD family transcriptional regulator